MALDQFMIAPFTSGLQKSVKPFLIPEDAFEKLKNAYIFRGRVRKRFGSRLIYPATPPALGFEQLASRLRVNLGSTDGAGDVAGTVPGWTGTLVGTTGQMFSIGNEIFTVYQTGAPAVMLTNSGTATVFTFNTTTGAYVINGSVITTPCYYYSAQPVMGFVQFEDAPLNEEPTYAFDTRMAYRYSTSGWERLATGTDTWTGTDAQFFWAINYRGLNSENNYIFVTNNSATDHVRYWNGATWAALTPKYTTTATDTIEGCRLIVPFKNRLLFLNTLESVGGAAAVNHKNRVRYCQNGSPFDADAWQEAPETRGKGGWIDATTQEAIVSAAILRDRLIVFFERSTWELVDTGNTITPFVFQKINSELGVESTFSTVLFDKEVLGVGNVGIHACNGANVSRIDEKIPDNVFEFHNENDGIQRVAGIRDYFTETVYWTVPSAEKNPKFPNEVIVYNYANGSWGINDDTITAFGYIQNNSDERWQDLILQWQEWDSEWGTAKQQAQFRQVLAGNQNGFTFVIDTDLPRNASALQITNMINAAGSITITVINHNMESGDYVCIENVIGVTNVDGIYQINEVLTADTFTINEPAFAGTYIGGGTIARVSQIDILTKQFNFYFKDGVKFTIPKTDFYVDRTSDGEISVDFFTSSSVRSMTVDGAITGALLGINAIETYAYPTVGGEIYQDRLWRSVYPQAYGEFIQIRFYLDESQMLNSSIAFSDFQLHAMSLHGLKTETV